MGGARNTHGDEKYVQNLSRRSRERPECRWQDNI